jgi:hypothetical protein
LLGKAIGRASSVKSPTVTSRDAPCDSPQRNVQAWQRRGKDARPPNSLSQNADYLPCTVPPPGAPLPPAQAEQDLPPGCGAIRSGRSVPSTADSYRRAAYCACPSAQWYQFVGCGLSRSAFPSRSIASIGRPLSTERSNSILGPSALFAPNLRAVSRAASASVQRRVCQQIHHLPVVSSGVRVESHCPFRCRHGRESVRLNRLAPAAR